MYDDSYLDETPYPWAPPPPDDRVLHLCPECRDLMSQAIRVADRPAAPPEPEWSQALRWLDALCGGRDAVLALDAAPLRADSSDVISEGLDSSASAQVAETAAHLDGVTARLFDEELGIALQRALSRTLERHPATVLSATSTAQLALGLVWAVGHANGVLWPLGTATEKELRSFLGARQSASTLGYKVRSALVGPYPWAVVERPWRYGGTRSRDLEALGHADLLTARTRRQLMEVRDRALRQSADDAA